MHGAEADEPIAGSLLVLHQANDELHQVSANGDRQLLGHPSLYPRVHREEKGKLCQESFENDGDMLTVLLSHDDIFTEEFLIDELCSLIIASVMTSSLACTTMLTHFIREPISLAKMR